MRRTIIGLTIGVVVAVFAVLPSAGAAPPAGSCVGLVVDTGHAVRSTCVPYKAGMTGQQLLQKAGHSLAFGDGFICQIDGFPARCHSDKTHYWSYYLRAPGAAAGAWTFSAKGANVEKVRAGETEGWAYVDGADRKPKAVGYPALAKAAQSASAAKKPASSSTTSGGVPWTLVIGVVVLVLVIAGGVWQARIRRNRA
jgi:hypothetical protein